MERVRMGWHSLECYTCKKAEPPSVDFGITSRSVTLGPPLSDYWCSLRCGIKLRLTQTVSSRLLWCCTLRVKVYGMHEGVCGIGRASRSESSTLLSHPKAFFNLNKPYSAKHSSSYLDIFTKPNIAPERDRFVWPWRLLG
jgi:hypothetical protein